MSIVYKAKHPCYRLIVLEALDTISLSVLALECYQLDKVVLPFTMRDQLSLFVKINKTL